MAEDLHDGEFWLPSEFLADDVFMVKEEVNRAGFPCEFPYDYGGLGIGSPVESVTETESDEEDVGSGEGRQMTRSAINDGVERGSSAFACENHKTQTMAGSPQSTLCAFGGWSRESSNGPSQVSSPPSPIKSKQEDAWDLLYAAAGQMVRLSMNDETALLTKHAVHGGPLRNTSPPPPAKSPNLGLHVDLVDLALARRQLQIHQFQQLKKQQFVKQQQQLQLINASGRQQGKVTSPPPPQMQSRARGGGGYGGGRGGAWHLQNYHPPPVQPGSGMRAVFLAGSGAKRESSGTGVFLPRRAGSPAESRKKSACSTVLLPARVVQALNLNLDDMVTQPRFHGGFGFVLDHESRNQSLNKRGPSCPQPPPTNHEIRLPQEWTY
ncbi:hypothetical protein QJS04_geneDACA007660 [Acorus gramineus]|uniref:Uncharacterized protein n=1 Tax=Acorus gramineus TaxID=55184 RepID=A0AAV9B1B4_ACOGR|nr:hypothetical protein QJS04_geneDACA007660 [Acorus gramineus]